MSITKKTRDFDQERDMKTPSEADMERVRERLRAARMREDAVAGKAARKVEEEREAAREAGQRFAIEEADLAHARMFRDYETGSGFSSTDGPTGIVCTVVVQQAAAKYGIIDLEHIDIFIAGALGILNAAGEK